MSKKKTLTITEGFRSFNKNSIETRTQMAVTESNYLAEANCKLIANFRNLNLPYSKRVFYFIKQKGKVYTTVTGGRKSGQRNSQAPAILLKVSPRDPFTQLYSCPWLVRSYAGIVPEKFSPKSEKDIWKCKVGGFGLNSFTLVRILCLCIGNFAVTWFYSLKKTLILRLQYIISNLKPSGSGWL